MKEYTYRFLLWLVNNFSNYEFSKGQIIRQGKYPINPDALSARVSELRAWDVVIQNKRRIGKHTIVTYSLNLDRACKVVNANGRLEGVIDKPAH